MKFSEAIRKALDKKNKFECPICNESAARSEEAGDTDYPCEGYCPATNEIARDMGLDYVCDDWGEIASNNPKSPERIAAEEIILCLKAQGD